MSAWSWLGGLFLLLPLGDIWVDAIGGTTGGTGTSGDPFKLITQGLGAASTGDVVKVKKGLYDIALGETFPLSIPSEVSVIGVDSGENPADFARIGGDLTDEGFADPDVKSLMVIDGRSTERQAILIQNFIFVGQDDEDFDSPPALLFVGASQNCVITGNTFLRGEMNDEEAADRATIEVGGVDESSINTSSIESNIIEPSARAAIEFIGVAGGIVGVGSDFTILGNTIQNPTGKTSEFGIHWEGLVGPLYGGAKIFSNQIVSPDEGIGTGVSIEVTTFGSEESIFHPGRMVGNLIQGCSGDGVYMECTVTNIRMEAFARNTIKGNGGSGVHIVWDPTHAYDGAGDINNQWIEGNLIVANDRFAYEIGGLGSASAFPMKVLNDTLANNGMGAFGFGEWDDMANQISVEKFNEVFALFGNLVMWGNNASGSYVQVTGLNEELLDEFIDTTHYSDWQYLPGTPAQGNIASDPDFLNAAGGDWHLDDGSPCIDSGRIAIGVTAQIDIDLADRVADGDHPICARPAVLQIDMGADEVPDPCEE